MKLKFFLFYLFLLFSLEAKEVYFIEKKFISTINANIRKDGILKIDKDLISLKYPKENKEFLFYKDKIHLKKENSEEILNYEDYIQLDIFYQLIKAIYTNNMEFIKEYFLIESGDVIHLEPTDELSSVISNIEYKKEGEKLIFLNIFFTDENRIEIVQVK